MFVFMCFDLLYDEHLKGYVQIIIVNMYWIEA